MKPSTIAEAIAANDSALLTQLLRDGLYPSNIPAELKALKAWLCWRVGNIRPKAGKFAKVPIYPSGAARRGVQGGEEDRARLGTFDQALTTFRQAKKSVAGIGLAMLPDFGLVALDVDGCVVDGKVREDVKELVRGTYAEASPSGRGIRAFWLGDADKRQNHARGFELYPDKQFVTVTGNQLATGFKRDISPLPKLSPEHRARLEALATPERLERPRRDDGGVVEADPLDIHENLLDELASALAAIPSDDRDVWVRMGHALKTLPGDMGRELWLEWSMESVKFDQADADEKWESFRPTGTGFKAVFAEAKRNGWKNPRAGGALSQVTGRGVVLTRLDRVLPEAIEWIVPGWLARGMLHVLAGPPSTGKTTVALAIAAALSAGRPVLGEGKVKPAQVLIWTGEDDLSRTIVPRLLAMEANMACIHAITGSLGPDGKPQAFDPARDLQQLAEVMDAMGGAGLMIVDSIVSAVGGDSNNNGDVRRGLQPLVDLGARHGCAILGISHFTKGTAGRDPIERVTGSLAFGALARVVMAAAKLPEAQGGGRVLVRAKSNIGPDGGGFHYDIEATPLPGHADIVTTRIEWGEALEGPAKELLAEAEGENRAGRGRADARLEAEMFISRLLADGEKSAKEMWRACEAEGYSKATFRRACEALGVVRVQRAGGWFWSLPEQKSADDFFGTGPDAHNQVL